MFLYGSRIIYMIMPIVGYFGSFHCGLTNAEAREAPIISTVMTASLQSIPSQITSIAELRQGGAAKAASRDFKTEAIFAMSLISTEQTSTVETTNNSSGGSSTPRATEKRSLGARIVRTTTLHIYPPAALITITTTATSSRSGDGTNGSIRIEPTHTASFSQYLLSSLPSNSTVNPHDREDDIKDCSEKINDEACNTYVTRWVDFYLNVSNEKIAE